MESIVAQAMTRNNWSKDYANKVLFEYKRFLNPHKVLMRPV